MQQLVSMFGNKNDKLKQFLFSLVLKMRLQDIID